MQDCLFCKICKGEIPSKSIYDDADVKVFLDINPANVGHCLVVPKMHSDNIIEADDKTLDKMIVTAKTVAKKLKETLNCDLNIIQNNGKSAGQLVSHIHFHLIPRFPNDHVVISYPRIQITEEQLEEVRKKLSISSVSVPKPQEFDF